MQAFMHAVAGIDWAGIAVPAVSILEKVLRSLAVYVFLIVALRVSGKREMAQLSTFDFVVLLLLSNAVQNAIIGSDDSVSGAVISVATLLVANRLVAGFFFRHQRLERAFEGRPDVFILKGKVNPKALRRDLVTLAELAAAARKQGIERLDDVEKAELDSDGGLVFLRKEPPPDQVRHAELLKMIDSLRKEIEGLREESKGSRPSK